MLRHGVLVILLCGLLLAGTALAAGNRTYDLVLLETGQERYSLDTPSLRWSRFASGEQVFEAWVRVDFSQKAYLKNAEWVKRSDVLRQYADKLDYCMLRLRFSPQGKMACMENISYGNDGAVLYRWREPEPDWRDIAPGTPGAVMLARISEFAAQEYSDSQPETVLMQFLRWYVDGRMRSDGKNSNLPDPLMSYAYLERAELTDHFKAVISAEMPRPGADPVLETQWIKENMEVGAVIIQGDTAQVSVYDFRTKSQSLAAMRDQQTPLLYALVRQNGRWLIDGVERESQWQVTEGFYKWYKEQRAAGLNPLASGAYRQSRFLTEEFKGKLDIHAAAMQRGDPAYRFDPFLFGYELTTPRGGAVEVVQQTAVIIVSPTDHLYTKGYPKLKVTLRWVDERWLIDAVEPLPADQQ